MKQTKKDILKKVKLTQRENEKLLTKGGTVIKRNISIKLKGIRKIIITISNPFLKGLFCYQITIYREDKEWIYGTPLAYEEFISQFSMIYNNEFESIKRDFLRDDYWHK